MEERTRRLPRAIRQVRRIRPGLGWPCGGHVTGPMCPVPLAKAFQSTTGLVPDEAEAHLGAFLSNGSRWSPRSWKSLQMEAQSANPYPKAAPSQPPASSRPKADVPECQANPGLPVPPASQKTKNGPQLPQPARPTGIPGLGWGIYQPKLKRAPQEDCEDERGRGPSQCPPQK